MFDKLKDKVSDLVDTVSQRELSEDELDDILEEFELSLLSSGVAMEVANEFVDEIKEDLKVKEVRSGTTVKKIVQESVENTVEEILKVEGIDLEEKIKEEKPLSIMFVGFNGSGKTTTIAKLANQLKEKNFESVIAASDTFRAGAIEQVKKHADNINVKLIKHEYGGDAAAVAYDAVQHAEANNLDAVLIDTAGRSETNKNLMDEMSKIKRVSDPDLSLFVGSALAGNSVIEQAKKFNESIGLDGVILTKVDADSKGGGALSIAKSIEKPILYVGTGQEYDDLKEFSPEWMAEKILS